VSKERARRRAEREAVAAAAAVKRARVQARRAQMRSLRRSLARPLAPLKRRRAWLFGRRSPGQRLVIGVGAFAVGIVIWYVVPSWPVRIAFWLLVLLLLPVLAVLTFDRKGMKL
jgi:Flp pilus assembly protein TadB